MLWDLIFGTFYDDTRRRPPAKIGIREAMPATFWGQMAAPFVWRRFQAEQGKAEREETKKSSGKSPA